MYAGPLFRKREQLMAATNARWYILSAKYGLLRPADPIIRYNETLTRKTREQRAIWALRVAQRLVQMESLATNPTIVLHAGRDYTDELIGVLRGIGLQVRLGYSPGLSIGRQLQLLSKQIQAAHSGLRKAI